MNTLFLIIITLLVLSYIRYQYIKTIELKVKYTLYAQRDKLRRLAITGKVDPNSIGFDFLDHTISQSIIELYQITLFRTVLLSLTVSQKGVESKKKFFDNEIESNEHLLEVFQEYQNVILEYIVYQHMMSRYIIIPFFRLFKVGRHLVGRIFRKVRKLSENMTYIDNSLSGLNAATH